VLERIFQLNMQNEEEVLPVVEETLDLLILLNSAEDFRLVLTDKAFRDFFLSSFCPQVAKSLIANKCFQLKRLLQVTNKTLEQLIFFFVRSFYEDSFGMLEMLDCVFDLNNPYFLINNQVDGGYNIRSHIPLDQAHLAWARALKPDDLLDALKFDAQTKLFGWARARIVEADAELVTVAFLNDFEFNSDAQNNR